MTTGPTPVSSAPLPPGRTGLPLLGETLAFVGNPYGFVDERLAAHGTVFRTHLLGRPSVVLAGPEHTALFIDESLVERDGAMPPNIQEVFAGRSLPLLDGAEHRARKTLVLEAFSRDALTGYLPTLQAIFEGAFARWSAVEEIRWLDELERLAIEAICTTILGLAPGAEMDGLCSDYKVLLDGVAALPIPLPGTRYSRALAARDRIVAVLRRRVAERRAAPAADGLGRMLAARTPEGVALDDDAAVLELHHVVIAGFIVFALLGNLVERLSEHPEVRRTLGEEVRRVTPSGTLGFEAFMAMPYLRQVVMEVKRLQPIIPFIFGKAKTTFEVAGRQVPKGWMVLWAVQPTNARYGVYDEPERFDPDRFSPARAEHERHPHAFVPQGAGPATGHRCPGIDLATVLTSMFAVVLLRDHDWELPEQSAAVDWTKTPPVRAERLRARVRRAASAAV